MFTAIRMRRHANTYTYVYRPMLSIVSCASIILQADIAKMQLVCTKQLLSEDSIPEILI